MRLGLRRYAVTVALLTLVYALVIGSFHPLDLLLGALVSAVLAYVFRGVVAGGGEGSGLGLPGRVVAFVPFSFAVTRDIIAGTWEVALVTLHLRELRKPGIVAVPVGERTPTGVAVSALVTTLSPGSFLVEVDRERDVMLIHTIDADDPEAVCRQHQEFYRRYQRKVFP